MSGLDKFMKVPGKSPKNAVAKDKEKIVKPKPIPKRAVKKESQESGEDSLADDSPTPPLEMDESEKMIESQDLSPEASIGEEDLEAPPESASHSRKFTKFQLKCASKKCNYQRILMKSLLSSSDLTCPKCGSQMRQKQMG